MTKFISAFAVLMLTSVLSAVSCHAQTDGLSRFRKPDAELAAIMDKSSNLRSELASYTANGRRAGFKGSIKAGKYNISDSLLYTTVSAADNDGSELIVALPHLGPGFDVNLSLYRVSAAGVVTPKATGFLTSSRLDEAVAGVKKGRVYLNDGFEDYFF
jgi:hypothetical protein